MDVNECANGIMQGSESGTEEIAVGDGQEMGLLDLKRIDPTQAFRALEAMADPIRSGGEA